ncbi:stage III sporulation protein AG [Paenibacillus sp. CAA11]|uniref:stage III sporulation protein AG n=1 Tax=Paenibacillus sp. CAA11 TaxID=1532905 RepID=UPI000D3DA803|nr:stage III sporulation protein AG [Paenibacillus sp. CAA11]AWB45100.1 stage III sporulation protein AG [Paenibacillus sp. CAA11]
MKWLKKLEQWLGKGSDGGKKVHTFRLLIIIGLVGAAFMLFNSFVHIKKVDPAGEGREPPMAASTLQSSSDSSSREGGGAFDQIEAELEAKTRDILEKIVGVGSVDVLVTVDSTEEIVVQRNMKDTQQLTDETDAGGGKRHVTEYTRDGQIVTYESSGNQQPIVTKKVKPKVRGVLVVAKGAENKVVKQMIIDAVEKGLNVSSYRISVAPRKQVE